MPEPLRQTCRCFLCQAAYSAVAALTVAGAKRTEAESDYFSP
jgi:hypothetical protein